MNKDSKGINVSRADYGENVPVLHYKYVSNNSNSDIADILIVVSNNLVLAKYIAEKNGLKAEYKYVKKREGMGAGFWDTKIIESLTITNTANKKSKSYSKDKISLYDKNGNLAKQHINIGANILCRDFQKELDILPENIDTKNFKHEPGDPFDTIDDAALAWALTYNSVTLKNFKNERLSGLYKDRKFKFTDVAIGKDNEEGNNSADRRDIPNRKGDDKYRGFIHSHPARSAHGIKFYTEVYSPDDLRMAMMFLAKPSYLITAAGILQKLTYEKRDATHYILARNLPGDYRFKEEFIEIHDYPKKLADADELYTSSSRYPFSIKKSKR